MASADPPPAPDLPAALRAVRRNTGARVVRAVDGRRGRVLGVAGDPRPDHPGDDPVAVAELVGRAVDGLGPGPGGDVVVATDRSIHVLHAVDDLPGAFLHLCLPVVAHADDAARHPAVRTARTALALDVLHDAVHGAVRAAGPDPTSPVPRPRAPLPARRRDQPALAALASGTAARPGALAVAALAELTGGPGLPRRAPTGRVDPGAGRVTGLPRLAWVRDPDSLHRVLAGLHRLS